MASDSHAKRPIVVERRKEKGRKKTPRLTKTYDVKIIPATVGVVAETEEPPKKRVAAYCRVSTDQEAQETSLEEQMAHFNTVIAEHPDWELAGIYADEGISGTQVKHRVQFQQMIEDAKAKKIDLILTKSISRFARNVVDCLTNIRLLRNLRPPVSVYFDKERLDSLDEKAEVFLTIRPKQQRLIPLRKGVLLGFVPIRPTWKAVSFKRLETATEKVMALVDAKPEQEHIEYESEECEMEILKGFEVINLKQPKGESVMTVTSNSLKFNKATAVELNYAPYIRVLLNAKTRQIAIQPCSEKDPNAIKFSNEESKQTYAISIKVPAIQVEFRRMLPFEDENGGKLSYTLNGTLYPDEQVVIYDIGDVKPEAEKKRRGRRKKSEIEAEQKEN